MLDLCDKHSIAQLHTVLSHGVCEVFKLLYSDYNKYYKYTGKIWIAYCKLYRDIKDSKQISFLHFLLTLSQV